MQSHRGRTKDSSNEEACHRKWEETDAGRETQKQSEELGRSATTHEEMSRLLEKVIQKWTKKNTKELDDGNQI